MLPVPIGLPVPKLLPPLPKPEDVLNGLGTLPPNALEPPKGFGAPKLRDPPPNPAVLAEPNPAELPNPPLADPKPPEVCPPPKPPAPCGDLELDAASNGDLPEEAKADRPEAANAELEVALPGSGDFSLDRDLGWPNGEAIEAFAKPDDGGYLVVVAGSTVFVDSCVLIGD